MIKLGALWQNEGKDGTYFAGKMGEARLIVLPNKYKNKDSQPDYYVFVDSPKNRGRDESDPPEEDGPF